MKRGIALGVPGVALATAGGLLVQARQAANAPLPRFDDLDPTGRYGDPSASPVRISVLGDSSMTGPGLERGEQIWVAQLAHLLPWSVTLTSHAKGGSRVRDVSEHQVDRALEDSPDLFVVSIGANDAMHATPIRTFQRHLEQVLDRLSSTAPVVTLGIGDLSLIPRLPRTFRPVVAHRSAAVDRTHKIVSADREDVVRVPVGKLSDPHFRRAGEHLFAGDLFHPNHRGHSLWAELFLPYVHRTLTGHSDRIVDIRASTAAMA